ncbi:MAG: transposase [Acidobacteria bacterium]|nr:transposase [Acidobacteriota bacterium]
MAQTFTNLLTHVIFSTKQRRPLLKTEIRPRLFAYTGAIVRDLGGKAFIINPVADHVHMLISMPATSAALDPHRAKLVRRVSQPQAELSPQLKTNDALP